MIELVFKQYVEVGSRDALSKAPVEIVSETKGIWAPRLSEDLDRGTSRFEAPYQSSVVAVAAGAHVE
jgi:hypothetical protein